ncbi:MAG: sigma-70 family RNA polymerase sigma factor [Armatimonadota bacterium]
MERLLARCRPIVQALILDRVRNPEVAEDLTQETLTDLSQSLPHLRDRQAFVGWLREIAINRCRRWWRRPELELQPLSDEYQRLVHDDTFTEAARRESWRELQRALDDLPETSRLALLMHVVGGLSQVEIGEILGITVTAVGVRIHRARRRLRRILQPLSPISEKEWDNVC